MDELITYESGSNLTYVLYAVIALCCALVVVTVIRLLIIRKKNLDDIVFAIAAARKRAERKDKILLAVYQTAANIPIVKKYLKTIELSYMGICPYGDIALVKLTSETATIVFFASVIGVIAVLIMNYLQEGVVSLYSIGSAIVAVYFISVETLHIRVRAVEKKLAKELNHYFATVKHAYLSRRNVPLAILEAADGMSDEINLHAMQLHGILTGTDRKAKVYEYVTDPRINKHLKMFMSQAYEASEQGDTIRRGSDSSVFTRNLEFLRVEIVNDAYRKEKKDFKFRGYSMVTCLPLLVMVPLRNWGIDFSPEMIAFYSSSGYLVMVLAFLVTILVYDNVNKAKEVSFAKIVKDVNFFDRFPPYSNVKKFMNLIETRKSRLFDKIRKMLRSTGTNETLGAFVVRMVIYVLVGTLLGSTFFGVVHLQNKKLLVTNISNIDSIVYVTSKKQKQEVSQHILDMTKKYSTTREVSIKELERDFSKRMHLSNKESVSNICNEVQRRVLAYQLEYFRWYEFLVSLIFGLLSGTIPLAALVYRYKVLLSGKKDEIRQFQSVIIMNRALPGITALQILEEMEAYAGVFKGSIRKCINCYAAGPRDALLELRDSELDSPEFVEIVDGFLSVETVGVARAFAEVQNNREMSENSRAFFEDMLLEKKVDFTDTLAMIPAAVVLGGYFIGPFCYYVLGSVLDMFDMLETFNTF